MENTIFLSKNPLITKAQKYIDKFPALQCFKLEKAKEIKVEDAKIILVKPNSININSKCNTNKLIKVKSLGVTKIYKNENDCVFYGDKNSLIHFTENNKTNKFEYAYIFFFDDKLYCLQIPC